MNTRGGRRGQACDKALLALVFSVKSRVSSSSISRRANYYLAFMISMNSFIDLNTQPILEANGAAWRGGLWREEFISNVKSEGARKIDVDRFGCASWSCLQWNASPQRALRSL